MFKPRYIQYLNLPQVPEDIIAELPKDINSYKTQRLGNWHWSDSHNAKINAWGKENICHEIYFAFQMMIGDLPIHKDNDVKLVFVYILETGGQNVVTKFWNDDESCLLDEYVIEKKRWHMIKVDTNHSVEGIEKDRIRWSIVARVF